MKIQNAPLTPKQLARIQHLIIDMNNKRACCQATHMGVLTLDSILKRRWASTKHIAALMRFCDEVEGLTQNNHAD